MSEVRLPGVSGRDYRQGVYVRMPRKRASVYEGEGEMNDRPCTRCGRCCRAETCMIGEITFGSVEGTCPALLDGNGIYCCGIVAFEEELGVNPMIKKALGIGRGCDSTFTEEPE